jgi:tetratricopeptide (TPR) repeat protein
MNYQTPRRHFAQKLTNGIFDSLQTRRIMQEEREIKAAGLIGLFQKMQALTSSLQEDEITLIKRYLQLGRTSGKKTQPLQTFEFLLQKNTINKSLIRSQYAAYKNKTVAMTLMRLREKVLSVLTSELNYNREHAFTDRGKQFYYIKDAIKQIHDLLTRGNQSLAIERINDAIDIGKKYEFYAELLESLYIKLIHLQQRSDSHEINLLEAEIDFYEAARRGVIYAERVNYRINTKLASITNPSKENLDALKEAIDELGLLYYQTQASFVLYYKYCLQIIYLQYENDYAQTETIAAELVDLVTQKPALASVPRIPISYMYLAQAKLFSRKFDETLLHCQQAKTYLKIGSWNYSETRLLEFYAHFYANRFETALAIIDELIDNPLYPVSEYKTGERRYLRVYALLALDRYAEAQEQLAKIFKITKDKTGWNIGLRLLSMLLCCLTQNFERMHFDHKSLLKDLTRIKDLAHVSKRDLVVASLLRDLLKSCGNFYDLAKSRSKDIALLASHNDAYAWKIMSHELIPFEQWLACKVGKRKTSISLLRIETAKSKTDITFKIKKSPKKNS